MARAGRKYYRTIFLGVAAMGVLVWAAVDQFGIPWEEMLELLLITVAAVVVVIAAAAATVTLWVWLRKWLRGDN